MSNSLKSPCSHEYSEKVHGQEEETNTVLCFTVYSINAIHSLIVFKTQRNVQVLVLIKNLSKFYIRINV